MNRYEIIIYWSPEDDAFIAEVPGLPGCAADGATHQQALQEQGRGQCLVSEICARLTARAEDSL